MVEFMMTHLTKRLPYNLYLQSVGKIEKHYIKSITYKCIWLMYKGFSTQNFYDAEHVELLMFAQKYLLLPLMHALMVYIISFSRNNSPCFVLPKKIQDSCKF